MTYSITSDESQNSIWEYTFDNRKEKGQREIIRKEKIYLGSAGKTELLNKEYSTIKFKDLIQYKVINIETEQIIEQFEFEQTSYWAEGIGLYKYEKPDVVLTLVKIIPFSEWNTL